MNGELRQTTVRLPSDVFDKIDELAKKHRRDRQSEIIVACEEHIKKHQLNPTVENLVYELEADPKFTELNNRYLALKDKFNKEMDKAFLEIMKGD